jgi:hypothetical protein
MAVFPVPNRKATPADRVVKLDPAAKRQIVRHYDQICSFNFCARNSVPHAVPTRELERKSGIQAEFDRLGRVGTGVAGMTGGKTWPMARRAAGPTSREIPLAPAMRVLR